MKTVEDARKLATEMVKIGKNVGRNTIAVISDMSQPLGRAIGNALEVKEAIETLAGNGPEDLTELCLTLGSQMVYLAKRTSTIKEARQLLEEALESGKALEKMKTFVKSQGGDPSYVENPEKLPQAKFQIEWKAKDDGWIKEMDAEKIGTAAMLLGAGRATKESTINLSVGLVLNKKIGDFVKKGDSLITIHANREEVEDVINLLEESVILSNTETSKPILIHEIIQ